MRAKDLVLRCMAERSDDLWVAQCLDFDLAAQGDSFEEAKEKLHEQIREYVNDAFGADREHAVLLLRRRSAPASVWAKYWCIAAVSKLLKKLHRAPPKSDRRFVEVMPMAPAHC